MRNILFLVLTVHWDIAPKDFKTSVKEAPSLGRDCKVELPVNPSNR